MSKSLGNTIVLNASDDDIKKAVNKMYTDPNHLKVSDPGQVEGNVVFTYLDAFDEFPEEIAELKAHYQRGGLGDSVLKKRLYERLVAMIAPIRERRNQFAQDPAYVMDVLREGTQKAQVVTQQTLDEVKNALGLFRF